MNFWSSANSLLRWRFQFVVIQKFCYHGNVTKQILLSINYSVPQARNGPLRAHYRVQYKKQARIQVCIQTPSLRHRGFETACLSGVIIVSLLYPCQGQNLPY